MNLRRTGCENADWINLAQDRILWRPLVNMINNPSGLTEGGQFLGRLRNYKLPQGLNGIS
jgi:hypothetical protein